MNILNKIKNDNEENIQRLKNIYELKINNNKTKKEKYLNLSQEKSINLIIINSMINDNSSFEKDEYEKKIRTFRKRKKVLGNPERKRKNGFSRKK
jgi:hypothetical protein